MPTNNHRDIWSTRPSSGRANRKQYGARLFSVTSGGGRTSKAAKILTEIQLQRAEELLAKNAGTVVAPIDGKVGKTNVTKGHVVGPESGSLTVIVSQKRCT